ncbi:translation initiation factor IF-2-like [Passer montanus]|uniref:translation initiation factor IF-2-like n=1 Tax=Passer montanus TaxID=9160 RepID=UPI0019603EA3|nr:translation initiation factor IF-2-like [Passer montanus]
MGKKFLPWGKEGGGEGWKEEIAGDPRSLFGEGWRSLREADPQPFRGRRNRRASSGSLVLPSCPGGPGDPAKSLEGSAEPAESRRRGGSDPRQSRGGGEAGPAQLRGRSFKKKGEKKKKRKQKKSPNKTEGGRKKKSAGGGYKKRSSSAGAVCPGGAPRPLAALRCGSPRGRWAEGPLPEAPEQGGEAAAEPRALLSPKGSEPRNSRRRRHTQGRGGRRRCCRWRSRCREAPVGASPPLSGASVGGCPAAASCGGGSLSAGPPWPERERIRLPAQLSVWKRGLVSNTGFGVAAPPSFEDLSSCASAHFSVQCILGSGSSVLTSQKILLQDPSTSAEHHLSTKPKHSIRS